MKFSSLAFAAGLAVASLSSAAGAAEITGAGATFPFPVYAKWAEAYKKDTNISLNYQSIGSSGGIRQIRAKTVDFGATDAPLKGDELEKDGFVQFPMVMGGVVAVYNIAGIETGKLKLSGDALADIFNGKITKWNDPKIAATNEDVSLPAATITPVYRSDGSGTTSVFTTYLSQVSEGWKSGPGAGASVQWPIGQGGKGNEGVAALVKQVPNAIGYVEYAYAKQNSIPFAQLRNKNGKFVAPDSKTFQAAAAGADWKSAPGYGISLTDQAATRPGRSRPRLHPGTQSPGKARAGRRSAEVLRLGVQERRPDGKRARLRAASGSGQGCCPRHMGERHQGQVRPSRLQEVAGRI